MDALKVLIRITSKTAPGMSPVYSEAHVLIVLQLIGSSRGIGRQKLSKEIGVGEGTVRTLIRRLTREGLVESSRRGLTLTNLGREALADLLRFIEETELTNTEVTVGTHDYAVLVKQAANHIKSGVEQRDVALLAGAKGATTLMYDGERLYMPGIGLEPEKSTSKYLIERLKPENGDVIIIGSSDTIISAEIGAKSVALNLIKEINQQSR